MKKINFAIFTLLVCLFVNGATATQKSNNRKQKKFFLLSMIAQAAASSPDCERVFNAPLLAVTKLSPDMRAIPISVAPAERILGCLSWEHPYFEKCVIREKAVYENNHNFCTQGLGRYPIYTLEKLPTPPDIQYSVSPASFAPIQTQGRIPLYLSIVNGVAIYENVPEDRDL